jgi:hypothetical protein
MNIQPDYSVEIRKEGSEKALVLIDKLTEAEANKVFKQISFPTRDKGYEKLYIFQDMVLRKSPL